MLLNSNDIQSFRATLTYKSNVKRENKYVSYKTGELIDKYSELNVDDFSEIAGDCKLKGYVKIDKLQKECPDFYSILKKGFEIENEFVVCYGSDKKSYFYLVGEDVVVSAPLRGIIIFIQITIILIIRLKKKMMMIMMI